MRPSPSGILILNVLHGSRVAAIPTSAGPARLLEAGLAESMEPSGLPVEVVDVPGPGDEPVGEVGRSFAVADRVARRVRDALADDRFVVVLSGSCHVGLGSMAGIPGEARGVVWLDAHGDFNTPETTGSGLLDGTTLASITGRCWQRLCSAVVGFEPVADEDVVLIGARSLDAGEAELLERSGVAMISAHDATQRAPGTFRDLGERVDGVYVHVDLDVLDPSVGRANTYAMPGGLSRSGLRSILREAVDRSPVRVLGFASYDPAADDEGAVCEAAVEIAGAVAERLRD